MNMQAKENLSTRRTNKYLKEAMIELMQKKPYSRITVAELTELAEIGKSTFYLHYHDIKELVDSIIDEFVDEVALSIKVMTKLVKKTGSISDFNLLIDVFERNRPLCLSLSKENADVDFYEKLFKRIRTEIMNVLSQDLEAKYDTNLTMDFIIAGSFGCYFESVKKGLPINSKMISKTAIEFAVPLFTSKN